LSLPISPYSLDNPTVTEEICDQPSFLLNNSLRGDKNLLVEICACLQHSPRSATCRMTLFSQLVTSLRIMNLKFPDSLVSLSRQPVSDSNYSCPAFLSTPSFYSVSIDLRMRPRLIWCTFHLQIP
jgi:hypothetical protein